MRRLHTSINSMFPDLGPLGVTQRDYTQGDGGTGTSPSSLPALPGAPGENGSTPSNYARKDKDERQLRRRLAKAKRQIRDQEEEIRMLGSLPDPEKAPYRGIPQLDGPVDRTSYIDKAASSGGDGPDPDYVRFVEQFANGGNPAMREHAGRVLKGLITAP